MNESSNTPVFDSPPHPSEPFYQVWIKAITKPNEQTYANIAESPDASPRKAYLWMFLVSLLSGLVSALVSSSMVSSVAQEYGTSSTLTTTLITAICAAPIGAAIGVLLFALGIALIQWAAKLFGGQGSYNKLVYVVACFAAPLGLVGGLFAALATIPYVGICVSLFSLVVGLYSLYLEILAVKVVNKLDWGKAAASVLLPVLIIGVLCACIVFVSVLLLGPAIGDVFSTINSSLGY